MEKRYQVIKPAHGYYKGECLDTDIAPTIDTGVGCWHTLIGESMEEIKCEQVGMLSGDSWDKCHETNRRVYSSNGLSPTITTMGGGQREPKIIEPTAYDKQNDYLRKDGCVGTLTTDGSSPKHNNRIIEPNFEQDEFDMGIICELSKTYRIRKLTERECFRLMGVKTEDFERIRCGKSLPQGSHKKIVDRTMTKAEWKICWRIMRHDRQSMSSCYHLAGDSIVTTCLMAIFGELLSVDYKTKINELVEELKQ